MSLTSKYNLIWHIFFRETEFVYSFLCTNNFVEKYRQKIGENMWWADQLFDTFNDFSSLSPEVSVRRINLQSPQNASTPQRLTLLST